MGGAASAPLQHGEERSLEGRDDEMEEEPSARRDGLMLVEEESPAYLTHGASFGGPGNGEPGRHLGEDPADLASSLRERLTAQIESHGLLGHAGGGADGREEREAMAGHDHAQAVSAGWGDENLMDEIVREHDGVHAQSRPSTRGSRSRPSTSGGASVHFHSRPTTGDAEGKNRAIRARTPSSAPRKEARALRAPSAKPRDIMNWSVDEGTPLVQRPMSNEIIARAGKVGHPDDMDATAESQYAPSQYAASAMGQDEDTDGSGSGSESSTDYSDDDTIADDFERLTELSTPVVLQIKILDSRVPYTGKDELECFPYIAMTMDPDQEHVSTVKQRTVHPRWKDRFIFHASSTQSVIRFDAYHWGVSDREVEIAGAELDDKVEQSKIEASKGRRGSVVVGAQFGHIHTDTQTEPDSNTRSDSKIGGLDEPPMLFSGGGVEGVMLHGRDFGGGAGTGEKSQISPAGLGDQGVDKGWGVRDDPSGSQSSSSSSSFSSESSLDPDGWGWGHFPGQYLGYAEFDVGTLIVLPGADRAAMNASIAGTSVQRRHGPLRSSIGGTGTGTGGSDSGGKGGEGSGGWPASKAGFDVRRKSSLGGKGGLSNAGSRMSEALHGKMAKRGSVTSDDSGLGGWKLIKRGKIRRQVGVARHNARWQEMEVFVRFKNREGELQNKYCGIKMSIKPWAPKGYVIPGQPNVNRERRKTLFGISGGDVGDDDDGGDDQGSDDDVGWYESEDEIDLGVEPHRREEDSYVPAPHMMNLVYDDLFKEEGIKKKVFAVKEQFRKAQDPAERDAKRDMYHNLVDQLIARKTRNEMPLIGGWIKAPPNRGFTAEGNIFLPPKIGGLSKAAQGRPNANAKQQVDPKAWAKMIGQTAVGNLPGETMDGIAEGSEELDFDDEESWDSGSSVTSFGENEDDEEDDDDKNMTGSWDAVGGGGEGTKSIMGVKSLMTAAGFLGKIASRNKTKGEHGKTWGVSEMSSRLKGDDGAPPLGSAPTKGSKWAVAKKTKNALSGFGMSTIVRKARKEGVINSRHAIGGRAWVELPDGDIECAKSGFGSFSTVSGRVYWMDDGRAGLGQSVEDEIGTWGSEEIKFSSIEDITKLTNEEIAQETSGRGDDASQSRKSYKVPDPKTELSLEGCVAVIFRNPPPARKLALAGDSSSDDDAHEDGDDYRVQDLTRAQWALSARCSAIIFVNKGRGKSLTPLLDPELKTKSWPDDWMAVPIVVVTEGDAKRLRNGLMVGLQRRSNSPTLKKEQEAAKREEWMGRSNVKGAVQSELKGKNPGNRWAALKVHVSEDLQKEALTKRRGWGFLGSRQAVDDLKDLQKGSAPTLTRQPSRVLKMKANLAREAVASEVSEAKSWLGRFSRTGKAVVAAKRIYEAVTGRKGVKVTAITRTPSQRSVKKGASVDSSPGQKQQDNKSSFEGKDARGGGVGISSKVLKGGGGSGVGSGADEDQRRGNEGGEDGSEGGVDLRPVRSLSFAKINKKPGGDKGKGEKGKGQAGLLMPMSSKSQSVKSILKEAGVAKKGHLIDGDGKASDSEAGHVGDSEAGHVGDSEAGHVGDSEAGHTGFGVDDVAAEAGGNLEAAGGREGGREEDENEEGLQVVHGHDIGPKGEETEAIGTVTPPADEEDEEEGTEREGDGLQVVEYEQDDELQRLCYVGRLDSRGLRTGVGTLWWLDGSSYEGEWRQDNPHGLGVETFQDGSYYAGSFHDDARHGWGMLHMSDGTTHSGLWSGGELSGIVITARDAEGGEGPVIQASRLVQGVGDQGWGGTETGAVYAEVSEDEYFEACIAMEELVASTQDVLDQARSDASKAVGLALTTRSLSPRVEQGLSADGRVGKPMAIARPITSERSQRLPEEHKTDIAPLIRKASVRSQASSSSRAGRSSRGMSSRGPGSSRGRSPISQLGGSYSVGGVSQDGRPTTSGGLDGRFSSSGFVRDVASERASPAGMTPPPGGHGNAQDGVVYTAAFPHNSPGRGASSSSSISSSSSSSSDSTTHSEPNSAVNSPAGVGDSTSRK